MKYVAIKNKELIIVKLDLENIDEILIEIAEVKSYKDCYFNKNKWYSFLKFVLLKYANDKNVKDKTKLFLYAYEWLDDFAVKNNKLDTYRVLKLDKLFTRFFSAKIDLDSFFKIYNVYHNCKNYVRDILEELFLYDSLLKSLLKKIEKEDFADLPKGWKTKLVKLEKYHNSSLHIYFLNKTFKQQLEVLNLLRKYEKRYGKHFNVFIQNTVCILENEKDVEKKFNLFIYKNNRLLCEPLDLKIDLIGKWTVIELTTTYDFVGESLFQNHCIGRSDYYPSRVRNGEIKAFSFRKQLGDVEKRHTIVYVKRSNQWVVEQDKGKNNALKEEIYDEYNLKYLEVNIERLKKYLNKNLAIRVGYDF